MIIVNVNDVKGVLAEFKNKLNIINGETIIINWQKRTIIAYLNKDVYDILEKGFNVIVSVYRFGKWFDDADVIDSVQTNFNLKKMAGEIK